MTSYVQSDRRISEPCLAVVHGLPVWAVAVLLTVVCGTMLAGCQGKPASTRSADSASDGLEEPISVRLQLNWFPEAEHGGFYAALVHGYFAEEGLEVEIIAGGPNALVLQKVASGQVEFGIENADRVLLGRSQEANVIALMAPMQESPRCILVHKSKGFQSLKDLKDVKLAVTAGGPLTLVLQKRLPLEGVQIVPYSGNISQFLLDDNFAQQGYIFSEPYLAENADSDPQSLMASEIGFNPYTSLLITRDQYMAEHRDIVARMTRASVRGWETYLQQPEQTNAYIHEQNPEMPIDALAYGVAALKPLCTPKAESGVPFGGMTQQRWQELADVLNEVEVLGANTVDVSQAFTNELLAATTASELAE